jgi:superfamily II DNA or RNA helicase
MIGPGLGRRRICEEYVVPRTWRNLVVAATGTGKPMLAGFDYARQPGRPTIFFLVHREELLRQARTAFPHPSSK